MLKDLFVPYEIAVILKNLGFNDKCLAWYNDNFIGISLTFFGEDRLLDSYAMEGKNVVAPLYQQALDFLRTTFKIEITVLESYETPGKFEYTIISDLVEEEIEFEDDHRDYYSCLIAAIMQSFEIIQKSKEVAL